MYVVPLPSERCTTRMSLFGSVTPGLSDSDLRRIPLGDLAEEDLGDDRSREVQRLRDLGQVVRDDDGAEHRRNVEAGALSFAISSSLIGASVAPKSTVPSVNWRMPPPDPIG